MIFRSTEYPSLLVHVGEGDEARAVHFQDGVLDTDDRAVIAHLEKVAKDGDGSIVVEKPAKRQAKPKAKPEADAEEPIPGQVTVDEAIAETEE